MPKGVKTLEKELRDAENILEHYEYHHRVSDLRRLPSREELEARIAKLKKALEKAKSKSGGTRRRRGTRSTRRR
jgi:ribosome-interacting GTPase 1